MNRSWTVVSHTGKRMDLECGLERMEINQPKDAFARQLFMSSQPGQSIDDGVIALLSKGK
jgi:hypothetical protein